MKNSQTIEKFDLFEARRYLHQHPEISNFEHKTQRYILETLASFGLQPHPIADTGVKVTIAAKQPGLNLAFRADIDALPINEANNCEYASKNHGVMHACGHDVHTAVALGIAYHFSTNPPQSGSVTILFQPAEEATPVDEPVGAAKMVEAGALDDPKIDAAFALHCMPDLDAGFIGYTGGPVWAESTLVEITIVGASSHAAYPNEGVDAVVIAAQVILALQSVASRSIDARKSIVLTIGSVRAGNTYNVLAPTATLLGTMRTLDAETTVTAKSRIRALVESIATGFGGRGSVHFTDGARVTTNDIGLEEHAVHILQQVAGEAYGVKKHLPQMASEDFSAFASKVPGCYLFLGVRNEARGITSPLHTDTFDVDERCLEVGVVSMSRMLREFLQEGKLR